MKKKSIAILLLLAASLVILVVVGFKILIGCGGRIVCHATEDYPPNCSQKGQIFTLLKNKDMFLGEHLIPDGAFYYLLAKGLEDVKGYGAVMPIEVAGFNSINLEEFAGKTICIEGKYWYGLPTFFAEVKNRPEGIGDYEQVVVDIEEIQIR